MKITVLTPTYNDAISIIETLDSLFNQTYTNFESIIIDDGSTDNTKEIIEKYKLDKDPEDKIKYIYQENKDQLNAIINGTKYITGDYVFTLHSDDLMPSNDFLEKAVNVLKEDKSIDAIIGDLVIINEDSEVTNRWKALKYKNNRKTPATLILNHGANIYGDVSVQKKEIFLTKTMNNYLMWNTPFWIDLNNNASMLNIKNVDFPILKYRIHSQNYISNEIGKFNALNGELRTLTRLLSIYDIPVFGVQKALFKFTRLPGVRRFRLSNYFTPIVKLQKSKGEKIYKIVEKAIKNTYKDGQNIIFLNSLLNFYKNINSNSEIRLNKLKMDEIYKGKDIRVFTKKMFANELNETYNEIFKYMNAGFSTIIVNDEEEREKATDLCKFVCIYPYVKIIIK